jgi:hypothetical protein
LTLRRPEGKAAEVDLVAAALLRRPLYGECYGRGDADW